MNEIIHGDCLEIMPQIPAGSVDMILCDLPYGTTACAWDTIIPFKPLWEQYERIIKEDGAIVLTASQPFTSALVMSNPKLFRYEWIWEKTIASNFLNLAFNPAKKHENILVFYKRLPTYNPQMEKGEAYTDTARKYTDGTDDGGKYLEFKKGKTNKKAIENNGTRYPSSVQRFSNPNNHNVHPTQKPIELFQYLIETYSNVGDTVLDNCIGSGTTAIAALSCGRNFIGIEKESEYVEVARKRLQVIQPVMNF